MAKAVKVLTRAWGARSRPWGHGQGPSECGQIVGVQPGAMGARPRLRGHGQVSWGHGQGLGIVSRGVAKTVGA